MKEYLEAGEIVNTHGIRGEVRVLPWADSPEFLRPFRTFYLDGSPMEAESVRVQKTCVLVKLRGVDTVEAAQALRGKTLFIRRSDAKLENGAYFVQDLIGLTAVTPEGETLGKVTDVIPMPKQDVYEIRGEKTYLVPAVKEFIRRVDLDAETIEIAVLDGMEETDEN